MRAVSVLRGRFSAPVSFLLAFAAVVASFAVPGWAAFNLIVDPFWRFDFVSIPGLNEQRGMALNSRLAKAQILCRIRPITVLMGTSRVEVGLNPKHPAIQAMGRPAYNLALAGSGIHELNLTLRHAVHVSPRLRHVLLGIDFLMFNANREAVVFGTEVLGFDEGRLLLNKGDTCWGAFLHDWNSLLGPLGYRRSLATLRSQMSEPTTEDGPKPLSVWVNYYDESGWRSHFDVIAKLDNGPVGSGGYGTVQESYYVKAVWRSPPDHRYCFESDAQRSTLDEFRDMLGFARESGIDLKVFINPIHARMLIAIRDAGLWPTYETWKRRLVETFASEAAASGGPVFDLWDFSGYNSVTTEHVPRTGESIRMHAFWEPSHYKAGVGDLMLDRMLGYQSPDRDVPSDFGIRMNSDSIDGWIASSRIGMQDYIRDNPDDAETVRNAVDEEMKDQGGSNCGEDLRLLKEAEAAFGRGDVAAARATLALAMELHERDRGTYAEIGVPYRETAFDEALTQLPAEIRNALPQ